MYRFHKADAHADAYIPALAGGVGVGPAAAKSAAETAAEQIAEDVAQIHAAKTAAEAAPKAAGTLTGAIAGVYPGEAELVVPGALLFIAEDLVGLVYLLELLLGFLVAGVQVGVVFFRLFAVGAFDLILRSALGNAQHLVIISFFCHTLSP